MSSAEREEIERFIQGLKGEGTRKSAGLPAWPKRSAWNWTAPSDGYTKAMHGASKSKYMMLCVDGVIEILESEEGQRG